MKTMFIILLFALITIAGEIYSDAVLTSGAAAAHAPADAVTSAIAHGFKRW
jgi:hypothetical protein